MYDFVVGGYLPGTNIQLSYQVSIAIVAVALVLCVVIWRRYRKQFYAVINVGYATLQKTAKSVLEVKA